MFTIVAEVLSHVGEREALLDGAFGPARFAKTCERLREGRAPAFAYAALDDAGDYCGTLRLWHVNAGEDCPVLLLGPLAVAEKARCAGLGARLMHQALAEAGEAGHSAVLLVGDEPYYRRFGFLGSLTEKLYLPGPVERARFLGIELIPGALQGARGLVSATGALLETEEVRNAPAFVTAVADGLVNSRAA